MKIASQILWKGEDMVHLKINLEQFEVLEQTPTFVKTRTTYPNGLVLTLEQTAEEISVDTNWQWRQESDGSLTPIQ